MPCSVRSGGKDAEAAAGGKLLQPRAGEHGEIRRRGAARRFGSHRAS
jgi:hypothetical protein